MNCQQGKSPILQLCPQRDSGNSRLHYLDFFLCDRKKPATQGEGDEAKSGKAQTFRHHHQSLVKGHWQETAVPSLGHVSGNQYCYLQYITCLHQSYFIFHLRHTVLTTTKKTPFNFRAVWTIDFTATILTLSPPPPVLLIFQSPGIDTQLLSHSVDSKQKCFVFDLNLIILVHSNASQVASQGFILIGLGQDKFAPLVT